jgi:hypothetical protein
VTIVDSLRYIFVVAVVADRDVVVVAAGGGGGDLSLVIGRCVDR